MRSLTTLDTGCDGITGARESESNCICNVIRHCLVHSVAGAAALERVAALHEKSCHCINLTHGFKICLMSVALHVVADLVGLP